jgi:hypothetical protein
MDEGVGVRCSSAGPGSNILRSPSSPMANGSDPKVNWVPMGNFMSKVQGAWSFRTDLERFLLPDAFCRRLVVKYLE